MKVSIKGNYNGTDENYITEVSFLRFGDDTPFLTLDKELSFNTEHEIDLINYKRLFNSNKTTVTVKV
jgi:hypothetical protein